MPRTGRGERPKRSPAGPPEGWTLPPCLLVPSRTGYVIFLFSYLINTGILRLPGVGNVLYLSTVLLWVPYLFLWVPYGIMSTVFFCCGYHTVFWLPYFLWVPYGILVTVLFVGTVRYFGYRT